MSSTTAKDLRRMAASIAGAKGFGDAELLARKLAEAQDMLRRAETILARMEGRANCSAMDVLCQTGRYEAALKAGPAAIAYRAAVEELRREIPR